MALIPELKNKTAMKKIVLLIALMLLVCAGAQAQGYFKKLGKSVKDKTQETVEDRTGETVDNAIGKAFDAIDGLLTGKKKKKAKDEDEEDGDEEEDGEEAVPSTWNCTNPECGHKGNTGKFCEECGTKRPVSMDSALASGKYATKKISFQPGSAELKFESVAELQKIAAFMKNDPTARFIVQVRYFNAESTPDNNISEDRAESVVKALADMGCDEFNLKAVDSDYAFEENADSKPANKSLKGLYVVFTRK